MKIGIIGATGRTGSALVQEAQARGHEVTVIVRNRTKAEQQFSAATTILAKDVFALTWDDLKDLDVIINAFASRGDGYQHLDLAAKLVTMTPITSLLHPRGGLFETGRWHHAARINLEGCRQ